MRLNQIHSGPLMIRYDIYSFSEHPAATINQRRNGSNNGNLQSRPDQLQQKKPQLIQRARDKPTSSSTLHLQWYVELVLRQQQLYQTDYNPTTYQP